MGYPLLRLIWATHGPPTEGAKVRKVRVGDVTIEAEREGPWRRPQEFFPAYDETW